MSNKTKLIELRGTKRELDAIDAIANITRENLHNEYNIDISLSDAIPTIVYEFIYATKTYLKENKKDYDVIMNNIADAIKLITCNN